MLHCCILMIYYEYLISLQTHLHISNSYPVYLRRRPESNLTISNFMYFSHADTFMLQIQSAPCERKKIRIGSLETCCVKAAVIDVHVDLIGMHYPPDAMMVPADFLWRTADRWRDEPKVTEQRQSETPVDSDLFDRPTVQKYSSCLRRSFLEAQKLCRSSRFVAVGCGRRHFPDSLKGDVCVFSPLCSQLVNVSSEIKSLRRLQHVFDSSSPYVDGRGGSQSTHSYFVSSQFIWIT